MDHKALVKSWLTKELPNDMGELLGEYEAFHRLVENTPNYDLSVAGMPALPQPAMRAFIGQLHAAMGMAGEAGEILEPFKKRMFGKHQRINEAQVVLELGDLFFYFVLMIKYLPGNLTLRDIIVANIRKLAERYSA